MPSPADTDTLLAPLSPANTPGVLAPATTSSFNLVLNALKQKGSPTGEHSTIDPYDTQPTNQPHNQPTNQPITPSRINQPTNQSTNQPTSQQTNQLVNKPTNQSTNQSTNQPITPSPRRRSGPAVQPHARPQRPRQRRHRQTPPGQPRTHAVPRSHQPVGGGAGGWRGESWLVDECVSACVSRSRCTGDFRLGARKYS